MEVPARTVPVNGGVKGGVPARSPAALHAMKALACIRN